VSVYVKFWIFNVLMVCLYLVFMPKVFEDQRFLAGVFAVFLTQGFLNLLFRCPRCRNPIIKRRTTSHRYGYYWGPPISRRCTNCGGPL
jgi:hypothetical protein